MMLASDAHAAVRCRYWAIHTIFLNLQPLPEPVSLDKKLPRKPLPPLQSIATVVPPILSNCGVEAHDFVQEVAQKLGLGSHLRKESANLDPQHGQQSSDEGRSSIDVERVQSKIGGAELRQQNRLHVLDHKATVVVEQGGDVRKEVFGSIQSVRGLVAVEMVAEAHLEGLDQSLEGEEHLRELGMRVVCAVELGHLEVEQLQHGGLPLLLQGRAEGSVRIGPFDLFQQVMELGGEGLQDGGAQGVGDLVDVVQQLGGSTFGVVLQALQAGVEGAQLLVGREGSVARGSQLLAGFVAGVLSAGCGVVAGHRALGAGYLRASTSCSKST